VRCFIILKRAVRVPANQSFRSSSISEKSTSRQPSPLKLMHSQPENMRPGPVSRPGIFLRNVEVFVRYISSGRYFLAARFRRDCREVSCGTGGSQRLSLPRCRYEQERPSILVFSTPCGSARPENRTKRNLRPLATGLFALESITQQEKQLLKKQCKPISQLSWLPGTQHRAKDQAQVEGAHVNQQALQNILLPS